MNQPSELAERFNTRIGHFGNRTNLAGKRALFGVGAATQLYFAESLAAAKLMLIQREADSMRRETKTLPSGKSIVRKFHDDGEMVEEIHSYGALDIGCTMTFASGKKVEETYYVKKRFVGRVRYEKARVDYADMPPADQSLADVGGELAKLARKEERQRSAAAKRRRADPLSVKQKEEADRQISLFQAAGKGDLETLSQLLDDGADPNWDAIESGHMPLYNACFGDSASAARMLIERGANPNRRFEYHSPIDGRVERGLTALMFAHSVGVAAALLGAGAEVNVHDENGLTPLMRAANSGNPDVVRVLLRAGVSPAARSRDGRSAADFAMVKKEFFRHKGAGFKAGHAEKRIKQFEEIDRLLAGGDA